MNDLVELSELLKKLNALSSHIGSIINRPAQVGHIGEFIAAKIFNITLQTSASTKSIDGYFNSGPLVHKSVNIKWYLKNDGLMNLSPYSPPDFYLVMTGESVVPGPSRGKVRPYAIEHVFLFNGLEIHEVLNRRGVRIGVASSILKTHWQAAEIYPRQAGTQLILSPDQILMLKLFGGS